MENKNEPNKREIDLEKNVLNEVIAPRIDTDNEIESGPKEELIASRSESKLADDSNLSNDKTDPKLSSEKNVMREEKNDAHEKKVLSNIDTESNDFDYQNASRNMFSSAENKKRIKPPIIVAILLILFLAIAGFASYYLLKDKNETTGKKETPQEIIKSSFEAMKGVSSYKIDGNTKFIVSLKDMKNETSQNYNLDLGFKGEAEGTDINNSKSKYNVKAEFGMNIDGNSENLSAEVEGMNFGQKSVYYKLNSYNLGAVGMFMAPKIRPFKGKWYYLDVEEMEEKMNASSSDNFNIEGYDPNKIMEIISKYEILKFKSDLGDAKIGDIDVYHYKAQPDGMAIAYMYLDVMKEMIKNSKDLQVDNIDKNINNAKKEIEKNKNLINNIFKNIEFEVWIGKNDKYIYKIAIKGDYANEEIKEIVNEAISILLGDAQANMRAKAKDATIKSQVASLSVKLVIYYDENNDSYEGFVLPPEYTDLKPENVRTSKDAYVVWSEMNSTTDKWCHDSTYKSGYVLGNVTGFECPSSLSNEPKGEEREYVVEDSKPISREEVLAVVEDAKIIANIIGVASELVYYYDNKKSYEGFVPSREAELKADNIKINLSKDSFVIWSEFNSTNDKFCVDSTKSQGYVLKDIEGFKCPESISNKPQGKTKDFSSNIETNLNFNLDMTFSDFNKPVSIEKPEGAIDLLKDKNGIMEEILSGKFDNLNKVDSDNDGLTDELEEFYGTDKNNPDTDGDGYKDGIEVENGYDPAVSGDAKLDYKKLYDK